MLEIWQLKMADSGESNDFFCKNRLRCSFSVACTMQYLAGQVTRLSEA